jgi:hypothetical protein
MSRVASTSTGCPQGVVGRMARSWCQSKLCGTGVSASASWAAAWAPRAGAGTRSCRPRKIPRSVATGSVDRVARRDDGAWLPPAGRLGRLRGFTVGMGYPGIIGFGGRSVHPGTHHASRGLQTRSPEKPPGASRGGRGDGSLVGGPGNDKSAAVVEFPPRAPEPSMPFRPPPRRPARPRVPWNRSPLRPGPDTAGRGPRVHPAHAGLGPGGPVPASGYPPSAGGGGGGGPSEAGPGDHRQALLLL